MKTHEYFLYIMANKPRGMMYVGESRNLVLRTLSNAGGLPGGSVHCRKYGIDKLVYIEPHDGYENVRTREIAVKRWRREWKINLVESMNPKWRDLWPELPVLLGLV